MGKSNTPEGRARDRIRALREKRGLTQKQVAAAAGMPRDALVAVEAGRRGVKVNEAWAIAAALGVSPWVLLATHPADDDPEIAGEAYSVRDVIAWEAGAVGSPRGSRGLEPGDAFALDVAEAFGFGLLPELRSAWEALGIATGARRLARALGMNRWRDDEHGEEGRLEEQAEEWLAETAEGWRSWLDTPVSQPDAAAQQDLADLLARMTPEKRRETEQAFAALTRDVVEAYRAERLGGQDVEEPTTKRRASARRKGRQR